MITLFKLARTAEGRRYLRSTWWAIRNNPRGALNPKSEYVTVTAISRDGTRERRVHHVPTRHLESYLHACFTKGEKVLIREEL